MRFSWHWKPKWKALHIYTKRRIWLVSWTSLCGEKTLKFKVATYVAWFKRINNFLEPEKGEQWDDL